MPAAAGVLAISPVPAAQMPVAGRDLGTRRFHFRLLPREAGRRPSPAKLPFPTYEAFLASLSNTDREWALGTTDIPTIIYRERIQPSVLLHGPIGWRMAGRLKTIGLSHRRLSRWRSGRPMRSLSGDLRHPWHTQGNAQGGEEMSKLLLSLLLVAVAAFWGWSFVLIRNVVGDPLDACPVLTFLAGDFLIAAAILAPFALRRTSGRCWRTGAGHRTGAGWWLFLSDGRTAVHDADQLRADHRLVRGVRPGVGLGAVPAPAATNGRAVRHAHEPDRARTCSWGRPAGPVHAGDVLTLACVLFGLHVSLLSHFAKDEAALPLTMVQMLIVSLGLRGGLADAGTGGLAGGAFLAGDRLMAVSVRRWLSTSRRWSRAVCPRSAPALILCMEPLFGAFSGYLFAGDRMGPVQIGGVAFAFWVPSSSNGGEPGMRARSAKAGERTLVILLPTWRERE